MKNTTFRKKALLSSVAMLLVALVALGSATFAWFSSNKVVTADGMKVTSAAAQGLQISDDNGGNWGNTSTFSTNNDVTLTPVSVGYTKTGGLATTAFYPGEVKLSDGGNFKTWMEENVQKNNADKFAGWGSFGEIMPAVDTTSKGTESCAVKTVGSANYFVAYEVKVRSSGSEISGVNGTLYFENAKNGDEKVLAASDYIRIAIYEGDTLVAVLGNEDNATAITAVSENVPTASTQEVTSFTPGMETVSGAGYQFETGQTITSTPSAYRILVWYEGQDEDCVDDLQQAVGNIKLRFNY